jgi:hypothetical protein
MNTDFLSAPGSTGVPPVLFGDSPKRFRTTKIFLLLIDAACREDGRMAGFLSASNGERIKGEVSNSRPVIVLIVPP